MKTGSNGLELLALVSNVVVASSELSRYDNLESDADELCQCCLLTKPDGWVLSRQNLHKALEELNKICPLSEFQSNVPM
jgi:hypothetical protein